jgi:hypothetical protein
MIKFSLGCIALLILTGCATGPQQKYEWGNYEQSMYEYYKNPADSNELILSIEKTIKTAAAENRIVAPGLYAEYGYLLMLQGKQQSAVDNFQKEKQKWPESTILMDRMIKLAETKPTTQSEIKK